MKIDLRGWWRGIDRTILSLSLLLLAISLVMVTTSSPAVAARIGVEESYFISKHLFYTIASVFLIFFISSHSKDFVRRYSILALLVCFMLMIATKFIGFETKGARRWLSIMGFSMQPSEFAKPFFCVVTGWILSLKYKQSDFPSFSVALVVLLIYAGLLIMQPDFGMLIVVCAVWGAQLFVAGLPLIWLVAGFILFTCFLISSYMFFPHFADRINSFLDPNNFENYQVQKALEAFQSGGFYGKGPGEGVVKQVLPDSHTDFIFAVAGEELGAILSIGIVLIYLSIIIYAFRKVFFIEDKFVQFSACGIITIIAVQSIINLGVNLNLLPTKGMTLPLISSGGSSMLSTALTIGILLALTKKTIDKFKYRINQEILVTHL